jgi:hypothetical protein
LEQLIAAGTLSGSTEVERLVTWLQEQASPPPRIGAVEEVSLSEYDSLLTGTEVMP